MTGNKLKEVSSEVAFEGKAGAWHVERMSLHLEGNKGDIEEERSGHAGGHKGLGSRRKFVFKMFLVSRNLQ